MNKCFIVGNLTRDPDSRVTSSGINVTSFTVAVNRRHRAEGQPEADFFRVTAWRGLADNCVKYLSKGKKVAVTGPVSVSTYQGQDGSCRASLELTADDVEFLTPKGEGGAAPSDGRTNFPEVPQGYEVVDEDDLPF